VIDAPLLYRLIAVALIVYWLVQVAVTVRKPADWQPRGLERFPFRVSRREYLMFGVLGVVAGCAVLGFSFVAFQ
jgi:hypothetical protein